MSVRALRFLLVVAVTGCLSACGNLVTSDKPLFVKSDETGAPDMRPGVWIGDNPDCRFDETVPMASWPKCADPITVGPLGFKDPQLAEGPEDRVAAGKPLILQKGDKGGYNYVAVSPTKTDERGRVTAFRGWAVLCGPPPTAAPGEAPSSSAVTTAPLPGLTIRDNNCVATRKSAVRRAAKASEAWAPTPFSIHWVREAAP